MKPLVHRTSNLPDSTVGLFLNFKQYLEKATGDRFTFGMQIKWIWRDQWWTKKNVGQTPGTQRKRQQNTGIDADFEMIA